MLLNRPITKVSENELLVVQWLVFIIIVKKQNKTRQNSEI